MHKNEEKKRQKLLSMEKIMLISMGVKTKNISCLT